MKRRDLLSSWAARSLAARALRAQQKTIPVIGWLSGSSFGPYAWNMAAFRQGLSETGYVEGQNVAIEIWAEGRADRLPELAADLVGRKVSVIVAQGGNFPALAAKNATSAIPIVFLAGSDPVRAGLVASFNRPGGNLTGICLITVELFGKRVRTNLRIGSGGQSARLACEPELCRC